jgi:hypothetical protein
LIPIPNSARLVRSGKAETLLRGKAREWIESEERTPGLHASDFMDPMMAFMQRTYPKPLPDKLITMFLIGKVLHAFVLGSVRGSVDIASSDDGSNYSESLGISYSPDLVIDGVVRELKTTRSYFEPRDLEDVSTYLEQLLIYMVATNTTTSQLWLLYLNLKDATGRTAPDYRAYEFSVTPEDLEFTKAYLLKLKQELDAALATGDPSQLALCRKFKCGEKNCQWWEDCKPKGRYGLSPKKWEA